MLTAFSMDEKEYFSNANSQKALDIISVYRYNICVENFDSKFFEMQFDISRKSHDFGIYLEMRSSVLAGKPTDANFAHYNI